MSNHADAAVEPVYLRALQMDDLSRIHEWHNDASLYESLGQPRRFVSPAVVEKWLRERVVYSNNRLALAICVSDTGEHVGNIYLNKIDWVARHAEMALFIADPVHQSKGYGQSAVRLMIKYAFGTLGLLRLHLTVLADNARAIKAYEKCGFRVEGRLRRHAYKNGQFKDMLVMGLCAGDTP